MGGVAPGWYPDYDAPSGHQRYWDGERWTERRAAPPATTAPAQAGQDRQVAGWVWAAVAALVLTSAGVLVVGDDHESGAGTTPPPASTPEPPEPSESEEGEVEEPERRTWGVSAAVDGVTIRLDNGAEVRLVGVDGCAPLELAGMVVGQRVTLTRRGPDKGADGRLLRYVERDGVDVGKRLLQRGWAQASDEPHPRRAIYRRIDARSPDDCG